MVVHDLLLRLRYRDLLTYLIVVLNLSHVAFVCCLFARTYFVGGDD